MRSLPKVLIIGQPFNNDTGGGITLSNFFRNWDKDQLAVACSGYSLSENVDTALCDNIYQLGYDETRWRFPFSLIQRKYFSGRIKFEDKRSTNITTQKSKLRVKMIMGFFVPFLEFIGLSHIIAKTTLSAKFREWITDFNPEVIYVQPTSIDGIKFCLLVHSFLIKPLVLHVMDDWPSTIADKGVLKKYWSKKVDIEFKKLINEADVLMSISGEMSRIYKIRYGKDFVPFHNSIDIAFWGKYQRTNYDLSPEPVILYAGRVGLGIETSLELIAKAIQKINIDCNISLKFILQTSTLPFWCKNYSCVEQKNFVEYKDLPKKFAEADFLLLPYDFSPLALKYIKYSMPTKAPEYMMSGTPIILFAPEETAVVKYCQMYDCAKIITENNNDIISRKIIEVLNNKSEREQIGMNAKKIAEQLHNSTYVQKNFEDAIKSVVAE